MTITLLLLAVAGAFVAGQLNRGIYRLAWHKRQLSPWSAPPAGYPRRDGWDRLPIFGWWWLRREAQAHGPGFWIRPALIEVVFAVGLPGLYWWELNRFLLPIGALPVTDAQLHAQFLSHACLCALMTVATFIDIDEKTIPDEITVPGTLLGVVLAGCLPASLLLVWRPGAPPLATEPLWLTSPGPWDPTLSQLRGLGLAWACLAAWWFALLPKTLWYRGGLVKFGRYLVFSILRHRLTPWLTLLALTAAVAIWGCWRMGGPTWQAVLTAWVGVAVGGGTVWLVRVVGSLALGQEAMGFGDVTLMGMIGAFLGWQASLIIFFLAPFTGVLIAVSQWLLTGRKEIAYGPFLCLSSLIVLLTWPAVWQRWGFPLFVLGWFVPIVLGTSLLLLGLLLLVIHQFRHRGG